MATIVLRSVKGSPLTNTEVDNNFSNINTELGQKLTGNQTITLTGDASGSGSTSIAVTLVNSGVTAGTYTKVTVDAKGRVTLGASLSSADLPTYTGTLTSSQVTTALGFTPPQPGGSGASGTWGISITGTARGVGTADPAIGTGGLWVASTIGLNVARNGTSYVVLDAANYVLYAPTLTGGGASGTWGISVTGSSGSCTGNAATASSASTSGAVYGSGFGNSNYTWRQDSGTFAGFSGWASYLISSHGDGATYYNQTIIMPFWGPPQYSRLEAGTFRGPYAFLTTENYNSYAPTLTGGGASGTWGISITGNAATVGGLSVHAGTNNEANKIVRTDGNGYANFGWINTASGDNGTTAIDRVYASSDGYIRYYTPANFRTVLDVPTRSGGSASGTWGISITGNAATVTNGIYTTNIGSYAPTLTGGGASGTWGINISGTAAVANSTPASGISGQSGMWTSANRPGPYRLYRNDSDDPYNIQITWSADRSGYWSLRGFYNDTYHAPCYVGYSGYADSAGNAGTVGSLSIHSGRNNEANKVVRTDGNGYLQAGYINSSNGDENNASSPARVWGTNGADSYLRSYQTSSLIAGRATRANGNFYIDDNYGYGIVGVYSASRYQGVFAMGDSYKLPADGTTVGSLYGIAWSHPNAGGAAGNLDSHGMLVLINGGFASSMSYSIKASGNVTAYSDERLKTNWRPMPSSFVDQLAHVRVGIYDRIDRDGLTQVGVSAQSLMNVLPWAVNKANDEMGTLSVSYGNAALASAVELARELVALRSEVESLKARLH